MRKIEFDQKEFIEKYYENYSDSELGKYFNFSTATAKNNRGKLGLKPNKKIAIEKERLKYYVDQGLSDYEISKLLNINHSWIFILRKRYGLLRKNLKFNDSVPLTKRQLSILIGHVLGDGHLKDTPNVSGKIEQGSKQKEYAEWKHKELYNLCGELKYSKRKAIDFRTGLFYESYISSIKSNPELNNLYPFLYKNKRKYISKEILEMFDELSLAVLFMDDGFKCNDTFTIATNCFSMEDLVLFTNFLYEKWNIKTTITKRNQIYILTESKHIFKDLIEPYIIPSMMYKISHVIL